MTRRHFAAAAALAIAALGTAPADARAETPILTRSYDLARTGANTRETELTPAQVGANRLGKRHSLHFGDDAAFDDDPRLEAQPLYVPKLKMNDGKVHDVVYVATMANHVWAFDADSGKPIWAKPVSLGRPIKPDPRPHPGWPSASAIDMWGINILWGILSTPVIDPDTKTMYVVNWTSPDGSVAKAVHQLHALDVTSGAPVHPPLTIAAKSDKTKPPKPAAEFHGPKQKQRSALLLVHAPGGKKTIFMACGMTSESDAETHGWVIAFDAATFKQTAAWCTTPNSSEGGIWQAGQGPAADENGDVFLITSNTDTARTPDPATDLPESFVRLKYSPPSGGSTAGSLEPADWFTPFLDKARAGAFQDEDLGSGGAVVLPGMNMVIGSGKDGVLYVLDKGHFGKGSDPRNLKQTPIFFTYFAGFGIDASNVRNLDNTQLGDGKTHHLHGTPVFWKSPTLGPMLFVWGENEALRAWTIDAAGKAVFVAQGAEIASAGLGGIGGMPGGMVTLSANGNTPNTGIVWATAPLNNDANKHVVEGVLRAYDATALDPVKNQDGSPRLKRLWDSKQIPGNTFKFSKFCPPVVADGKVFVATYDGRVDVYGLPGSPRPEETPVNGE